MNPVINKRHLLAIAAVAALVIVGLRARRVPSESDPGMPAGDDGRAERVAREWVVKRSPTYVFDGDGLTLRETRALTCQLCYEFVYDFQSQYAGYGKRDTKAPQEAPTPHVITVVVEKGRVTLATTDGRFDETHNQSLAPGATPADAAPSS